MDAIRTAIAVAADGKAAECTDGQFTGIMTCNINCFNFQLISIDSKFAYCICQSDIGCISADRKRFIVGTIKQGRKYKAVIQFQFEDLIGTEIFNDFLRYYESAIEKLNTTEEKIRLMKMDADFWEMSMLEFLPISE